MEENKKKNPWKILNDDGIVEKSEDTKETDKSNDTAEAKADEKPAASEDTKKSEDKSDKSDKNEKSESKSDNSDKNDKSEDKSDKSDENKKSAVSKDFLRNIGTTGFALLMALIVAIAVIPINLIASRLNIEWDMTPENIYSAELSDASKEVIASLNNPVEIYFLMNPDELDEDYEVGRVLKNTLEKYDEYENITLIAGDPDEHPEYFSEFADTYSLGQCDIVVKGFDGLTKYISAQSLFITEPLTSNAQSDNVDDYSFTFVGENYITGAIKYVNDGISPAIYFLKGHNEKSIKNDYTTLTQIFESYGYVVDDINLQTNPEIPENTEAIIIAAPQEDISDKEFNVLNSYLDNGGHIAFLMSPNKGEFDYTNIDALMYNFGIGLDYDRVYETDSNMYLEDDQYTIAAYLNDRDENLTWIDEARMLAENGYPVVMPESRSFYSYDEVVSNNASLSSQPIIYTSGSARAENYGGIDKDGNFTDGENLYLAAYSQDAARNNAKIIVWGNAEFASDEMINSADYDMLTRTTLSAFISSVSWMYENSIEMETGQRSFSYDYMRIDSQEKANKVLAVIILVPVLVAGIGVLVWARRKNA